MTIPASSSLASAKPCVSPHHRGTSRSLLLSSFHAPYSRYTHAPLSILTVAEFPTEPLWKLIKIKGWQVLGILKSDFGHEENYAMAYREVDGRTLGHEFWEKRD
ncbi:hypothetical protein M0R45_011799 [Rubus argutus]|uniref:Uncharacterized protein n=1 Tax=Rubus argutus TaxID=59490 RepID=A0AAW1YCP1_RUBAR